MTNCPGTSAGAATRRYVQEVEIQTLLAAQGKALALTAAVLEQRGVITTGDFGDMLELFAAIVSERTPDEGEILAQWALTLKGVNDIITGTAM